MILPDDDARPVLAARKVVSYTSLLRYSRRHG